MNKINSLFANNKDTKLLSLYFCAGCPTLEGTADVILTLQRRGIAMIEVGIPFSVDEAVKVTDGPFNGFSGIIEEVNADKRKLKVMVKIFGRKTPLELSYNQVEKE